MAAKIFHNPNCGTSRNVLALLRHYGETVEVIDYLAHPPSVDALKEMIEDAGLSVRQAIRDKQPEYAALGLDQDTLSDEDLLRMMVETPILINRPFVITELGVRLARPSEKVLEILPQRDVAPFYKEDGTKISRDSDLER